MIFLFPCLVLIVGAVTFAMVAEYHDRRVWAVDCSMWAVRRAANVSIAARDNAERHALNLRILLIAHGVRFER